VKTRSERTCHRRKYGGAFGLVGCHNSNRGHSQQGLCRKFTIPASEQIKVLTLLDEFNVNSFSLFGSEESLMETLAAREFLLGDDK